MHRVAVPGQVGEGVVVPGQAGEGLVVGGDLKAAAMLLLDELQHGCSALVEAWGVARLVHLE